MTTKSIVLTVTAAKISLAQAVEILVVRKVKGKLAPMAWIMMETALSTVLILIAAQAGRVGNIYIKMV